MCLLCKQRLPQRWLIVDIPRWLVVNMQRWLIVDMLKWLIVHMIVDMQRWLIVDMIVDMHMARLWSQVQHAACPFTCHLHIPDKILFVVYSSTLFQYCRPSFRVCWRVLSSAVLHGTLCFPPLAW